MPSHRPDVPGVIWPLLDGGLDQQFREEVRAHLARCPECGRRYAFEQALRTFLRRRCGEVAPDALERRLREMMDRYVEEA